MKNQYFGDDRDLFKYDLAETLIRNVPSIRRFTFVPLLTPDDDSGHGDVVARNQSAPGSDNPRLVDVLDSCLESGRRYISEIRAYFEEQGIPVYIHKEDCYLDNYDRARYFDGIDDSVLTDALVFLDPDNGLEVQSPTEKHVLTSELLDFFKRMTDSSILMFFQYRPPYTSRADLTMNVAARLYNQGVGLPLAVAGGDVVFFLYAKEKKTRDHLARAVAQYEDRYPTLRLWNI